MKDISTVNYHPVAEQLVSILCKKTQNDNPLFFRVLVAYYFSKVASTMRTNIKTLDRGVIPVNIYALNLAPSGYGKGHSTNIMEDLVIAEFKDRFMEETFPEVVETNLAKLAVKRAYKKGTDDESELKLVKAEFARLGELAFSFDSGTTAAVKQMRHKLLMANAGAVNLEIDEIGSNLLGNVDVLTTFLELFDVGKVKQKLTKNTNENIRSEEIDGRTPTNLMLFGTPAKVFNGGKTEEELYSMLETGYGRRCIFGYSRIPVKKKNLTPQEIYDSLVDTNADIFLDSLKVKLGDLAGINHFNQTLTMSKDVTMLLLAYKLKCENIAHDLPDHDEIRKAEISHRYFKALKLAGAYAFIDAWHEITEDHLYAAIKLVEDSGEAFNLMLTRDRNYVKLANYIANIEREVTHVDLMEDLPFYKGSASQRAELMNLAIAYGYKNHIIIKKSFADGIEFLRGESLKPTDLSKMIISYSTDIATGYMTEAVPFDKLETLTQMPNYHWCNHGFLEQHRKEENAIQGFNMIVLDVDGGTPIQTAQLLLKNFTYHMYTTKRHTDQQHRYRIVLPISHQLKLDAGEFKEFMANVAEWLPFEVDTATGQRARKWMTHTGSSFYNKGELLDALQFIPKTTKNEERKKLITDTQSLTNLERWFAANTGEGNRSNQLIKYALMLVDSGMQIDSVRNAVMALNDKLQDKMDPAEILTTIMVTASKAAYKRDAGQ
jgi:uncharacterized protein Usg